MSDLQRQFTTPDPLRDSVEVLKRLRHAEDLVARAAELLAKISRDYPPQHGRDWYELRDQWLDDSGIGHFSKESLKAAMEEMEDDE